MSRYSIVVLTCCLACLAVISCLEDPDPVDSSSPEPGGLLSPDSAYFWFPGDTSDVYTWNTGPERHWGHVWSMTIPSPHSRYTLHAALVTESDGTGPRTGSLAEMAADARAYFWTEDRETGSWAQRPISWGDVVVRPDGVAVRYRYSLAEVLYYSAPRTREAWWATCEIRTPGRPARSLVVRLRLENSLEFVKPIEGPLSDDEYAIYQILLRQYGERSDGPFFVLTPTLRSGVFSHEEGNVRALRPGSDTLRRYLNPRPEPVELTNLQQAGYTVVDRDLFYGGERPTGYRTAGFSRVAFSRSGTEALVYISYYCGSLCAEGEVYLLLAHNGRWKVAGHVQLWIS